MTSCTSLSVICAAASLHAMQVHNKYGEYTDYTLLDFSIENHVA